VTSIAGLGYVVGGKECLVCRHCARPLMVTIVGETLHATKMTGITQWQDVKEIKERVDATCAPAAV
jgi:hypothetical protein